MHLVHDGTVVATHRHVWLRSFILKHRLLDILTRLWGFCLPAHLLNDLLFLTLSCLFNLKLCFWPVLIYWDFICHFLIDYLISVIWDKMLKLLDELCEVDLTLGKLFCELGTKLGILLELSVLLLSFLEQGALNCFGSEPSRAGAHWSNSVVAMTIWWYTRYSQNLSFLICARWIIWTHCFGPRLWAFRVCFLNNILWRGLHLTDQGHLYDSSFIILDWILLIELVLLDTFVQ